MQYACTFPFNIAVWSIRAIWKCNQLAIFSQWDSSWRSVDLKNVAYARNEHFVRCIIMRGRRDVRKSVLSSSLLRIVMIINFYFLSTIVHRRDTCSRRSSTFSHISYTRSWLLYRIIQPFTYLFQRTMTVFIFTCHFLLCMSYLLGRYDKRDVL